MSIRAAFSARFAVRLGARATLVAGAYLAAAAAVLLTVIWLRGLIAPADLRGFLAFVFIASLSAGLEPGTVKADALRADNRAGLAAILGVGALKGLVASPILALIWRFADPGVAWSALAWTPLVCVAGFCATDLRVLLDLRGRYALAIGLKQGSLAGGIVLAGALIAAGAGPALAFGASTLARLALLAVAGRAQPPGEASRRGSGTTLAQARGLLADPRWADLAAVSVIAAISGSADRLFGLRYLSAADYGGYYLVFELFSKFWLIPYVLAPIVFARRAAGQDTDAFLRGAWAFTALAGVGFLAAMAGLLLFAPTLLARLTGASFGLATLVFGAGVVIGAFAQLRIAALQGAGASRRAVVVMGLSAIFSVALFLGAARGFGAPGLLAAWLIKSAVELAAAMLPARPRT